MKTKCLLIGLAMLFISTENIIAQEDKGSEKDWGEVYNVPFFEREEFEYIREHLETREVEIDGEKYGGRVLLWTTNFSYSPKESWKRLEIRYLKVETETAYLCGYFRNGKYVKEVQYHKAVKIKVFFVYV